MTCSSNEGKVRGYITKEEIRHERGDEPGKACFEGQHLESTRIRTLRGTASQEHQKYQSSTSQVRIHLEGAQYGSQPEGPAQGTCCSERTPGGRVENMMTSLIQSSRSRRIALESLRAKDQRLWVP